MPPFSSNAREIHFDKIKKLKFPRIIILDEIVISYHTVVNHIDLAFPILKKKSNGEIDIKPVKGGTLKNLKSNYTIPFPFLFFGYYPNDIEKMKKAI